MASMTVTAGTLHVRLSRWEKLFALHRDLRVPVAAIARVDVEPDGLAAVRGIRAPGLGVPRVVKLGTWRRRGGSTFAAARRGMPAVRLWLRSGRSLVVSTPHAEAVAEGVRAAAGLPHARRGQAREIQVGIDPPGPRLSASLRLPAGPGPHPAALLLPGSGPIDRDGSASGFRLRVLSDLAEALARHGIASLRYDRRGVGASEGGFLEAGLHDNVDDAERALVWLRGHQDVREDAIFLVGHSEGALLAALLGARESAPEPAGVVLLAMPARPGEEMLLWQAARIAPTLPRAVRLVLRLLGRDVVGQQARALARLKATTGDVERIGGRRVNARWHRELIAADPRPALARLDMPVLAITGDKDIQVAPEDLVAIAATVAGPVETERVPDLTHVLRRDSGPPSLGAYRRQLKRPTDPGVLDRVAIWIAETAGSRPAG